MTVELKPKRWRPARPASELAGDAQADPSAESGIGFSGTQPINRSELLGNSCGPITGRSMDAAGSATIGEAASRLAERQADLVLLHRFADESDAGAFGELVRRYAAAVYATCLRILGDGGRAEDASQETFFRLMKRPRDVNQCVGAWLHRTATHLSLDLLRSEHSRRRREIAYVRELDRTASTWAELSPTVDQALDDLPEEYRALLVQHYLMGRSQAELAAEAGQSPATVCRRLQRGLELLRQHLRLKGVDALPMVLAGLLCNAAARQAPAALVAELGKMTMLCGTRGLSGGAELRTRVNHPAGHSGNPQQGFGPGTYVAAITLALAVLCLELLSGHSSSQSRARPSEPVDSRPAQRVSSAVGSAAISRSASIELVTGRQ